MDEREPITVVTTESGAVYHLTRTAIRRFEESSGNAKRADQEWVKLLSTVEPVVGQRMVLILESLADKGPDDHGTVNPGPFTTRTTTQVVSITPEGSI